MASSKKQGVYFVPIGGADNIGMNMFAYSSNGKWIVVDSGYGFLNDDYRKKGWRYFVGVRQKSCRYGKDAVKT